MKKPLYQFQLLWNFRELIQKTKDYEKIEREELLKDKNLKACKDMLTEQWELWRAFNTDL